ncbi:MAG: CDP-glycerol glycerophosphotransferase family protein [Solibacillus sp.]
MNKIIIFLLRVIATIVPARKKIIFQSFPDLTGNSKKMYDLCIQNKLYLQYELIWFVSEGQDISSLKERYAHTSFIEMKNTVTNKIKRNIEQLQAKYLLFDNGFLLKLNKRTTSFYLQHGTPLKDVKDIYQEDFQCDYVISATDYTDHLYLTHIDNNNKKALGFPRNDDLFSADQSQKDYVASIFEGFDQQSKLVVWLPTLRHDVSGRNDLVDEQDSFSVVNIDFIEKLNAFLKDNNTFILIKPHPIQDLTKFNDVNTSNIKVILDTDLFQQQLELHHLLGCSDALITDYSSIYFDYLLLNKPVAFTHGDKGNYKLGFLYDNLDELLAGAIINTNEQFFQFLISIVDDVDDYAEQRAKVNKLFNTYQDGKATERVYNFILSK